MVAGAISLMLSVNPNLTYAQIVQGLKASARPHVTSTLPGVNACSASNPGRCLCTTATCGAGMLDAEQALRYAAMPDSYVAPVRAAAVIDHAELDAALARAPQDRSELAPAVADGGGGGGAMGGFWLLALATASLTLRLLRRPASR